jgi:hypothetical protein
VKRVHRNLSRDEAEALRERLSSLVPSETVVEVGANAMDDSNAAPASRSPGNGSNSAARGALKRALKKG